MPDAERPADKPSALRQRLRQETGDFDFNALLEGVSRLDAPEPPPAAEPKANEAPLPVRAVIPVLASPEQAVIQEIPLAPASASPRRRARGLSPLLLGGLLAGMLLAGGLLYRFLSRPAAPVTVVVPITPEPGLAAPAVSLPEEIVLPETAAKRRPRRRTVRRTPPTAARDTPARPKAEAKPKPEAPRAQPAAPSKPPQKPASSGVNAVLDQLPGSRPASERKPETGVDRVLDQLP